MLKFLAILGPIYTRAKNKHYHILRGIKRIITFNEHRCLCRWSFLATFLEHDLKNTRKKPLGQVKHLMEVLNVLISIVSQILACHDDLNRTECCIFSHARRQNVEGGILHVSPSCLFS